MGHGASGAHGLGHDAAGGASPFNMGTMLAFLTWFGGAGYLLTAHFGVGTIAALILSAGIGVIGGAIVFFFLARVLLRGQTPYLRSEDYTLEGTIGRLSVGIRSGRTGEVVYSKAGTRRVASARSADGEDIAQGAEVVVISQEGGIAYVRRFEELLAEEPPMLARN
jgi:membrane protein implicated in regulation of membrane protease activity